MTNTPSKRPPLDLGAMAAPNQEENVARMENLVATFNKMLSTKLELLDDPAGGSTDCKTVVKVPFADPEAYLICEHELSHAFAETDLDLTKEFTTKAVERLLTRARLPLTSASAAPYRPKLQQLVHLLWNVLEDWRCCSVWGEIYFGGASLLQQRWKDIAKYSKEEDAEKDLVTYLMRAASGFETDKAPPEFKACRPHMERARSQVELVDNAACLAVTARLIDDIADELLKFYPPPPSNTPNNAQQTAMSKLTALSNAVQTPAQGPPSPPNSSQQGLGHKDVTPDLTATSSSRANAKTLRQIRKLMTADDDQPGPDGKTSFQSLCEEGAEKMNARIAAAKAELGKQRKSNKQQQEEILSTASSSCAIRSFRVTPAHKLPPPSSDAGKVRRYLEQVKMEQEKISCSRGSKVNIPKLIQASASGDRSSVPLFQKKSEVGGLQLLILADVSGSMSGPGLDILDRAISDVQFSCTGLKVDINLWTFSSDLYFFTKIGSVKAVPGMYMMYTNMVRALDVAIEWEKQGKGDRAVILMTDGMPTHTRGRKSSGNAVTDLTTVMRELRKDGVVLTTLAIGPHEPMFDGIFGKGNYGLVKTIQDLPAALTNAVRIIIEAHLRK